MFEELCSAHKLPQPEREVKFHPSRKWKVDFGWPNIKLALEIEGGAFKGHGHRSVGKFLRDMEKYNHLTLAGWMLLRCTTKDIETCTVFELLKEAIETFTRYQNWVQDLAERRLG